MLYDHLFNIRNAFYCCCNEITFNECDIVPTHIQWCDMWRVDDDEMSITFMCAQNKLVLEDNEKMTVNMYAIGYAIPTLIVYLNAVVILENEIIM